MFLPFMSDEDIEADRLHKTQLEAIEKDRQLAMARDWKARHPDEVKESRAAYYSANKAREKMNGYRWRLENPERMAVLRREWELENREWRKEWRRRYARENRERRNSNERKMYRIDLGYAIEKRLRASMTQAIRTAGAKKSETTFALIGCSSQSLVRHIESKFKDGMSWGRRSEIHIDHIRPVASFDLTDPEQQRRCFHYTNLQPLWAWDNQSKSDKWDSEADAVLVPGTHVGPDGVPEQD